MRCDEVLFQGKLIRIDLYSEASDSDVFAEYHDESVQQLTIEANGTVGFMSASLDENKLPQDKRDVLRSLSPEDTEFLLDAFSDYFSSSYERKDIMEEGEFRLELTNSEGDAYRYGGTLVNAIPAELSELVRRLTGIENMLLFGLAIEEPPDHIRRLRMKYKRVSRYGKEDEVAPEFVWDYEERLTIDRDSSTFELVRDFAPDLQLKLSFKTEERVSELLDELSEMRLFKREGGFPQDVLPLASEERRYSIKLSYLDAPERRLEGSFDAEGLPPDFKDFAEKITVFLSYYGQPEFLDPVNYLQPRRREGELIYCRVEFENSSKSYYYLADEDLYVRGDYVMVPLGPENIPTMGRVIKVEYVKPDEAPWPPEETKKILRHVTREDLKKPEE